VFDIPAGFISPAGFKTLRARARAVPRACNMKVSDMALHRFLGIRIDEGERLIHRVVVFIVFLFSPVTTGSRLAINAEATVSIPN
jgi:hypothetical protein